MTRPIPAAALAIYERRSAMNAVPMVWLESRDYDTSEVEGIGLWGGEDVEVITVEDLFTHVSSARTFYNGGILEVGSVRHVAGLDIRPTTLRLSGISPAVLEAFRAYNARGAQVQAWKRVYDPFFSTVVVQNWFKGYVNTAPSERPAPGGEASLEVEIVSTARMLTITSSERKSHEAQQRRSNDQFRKFKATAAEWTIPWGEKDERYEPEGWGRKR